MCIECQRSTPSAETFSKIVFSASEKIDLTFCCPFLIKNTIVGHVIVRLDYTVTENVMGSLDIKIKPQFFSFFSLSSQKDSPIPVCLYFAHYSQRCS